MPSVLPYGRYPALGLSGKTKHFQLDHIPRRSTLSDANQLRTCDAFGYIYNQLLLRYGHHDHVLLSKLKMDPNTIYVFDKGYNDYKAFQKFCNHQTGFVTRIKDNAVFESVEKQPIEEYIHSGVKEDEIITLTVKDDNGQTKLKLRKIRFYDRELKREFEFLTNLFEMRADLVAAIYKLRWQIELLFKQLKQNYPLKYFVG